MGTEALGKGLQRSVLLPVAYQIPDKTLKGERVCLGAKFEGTVYHGGESVAAEETGFYMLLFLAKQEGKIRLKVRAWA